MRNNAVRAAGKTAGSILWTLVMGLAFLALGIAIYVYNPHYVKTTGTVTAVNAEKATVAYTVRDQQYTAYWSRGTYQVGDQVTIYYDKKDPGSFGTPDDSHLDLICMAAGIITLAFTVFRVFKGVRVQQHRQTREPFPPITLLPKEQMDEYRVSNDGKMIKQGYKAWDSYGTLVYEWHPTHYVPFKGQTTVYTNHRTGRTTEHVWNSGEIESGSKSGRPISVGFGTIQRYRTTSRLRWFNLDGRDLWDVLGEKGVSIRTQMEMDGVPKITFTVAKDGCHFATIEMGGSEHMQELREQGAGGGLHYKCWTAENDLDLLFLIVSILAATDNNLPE